MQKKGLANTHVDSNYSRSNCYGRDKIDVLKVIVELLVVFQAFEEPEMYLLVGCLCGLAIYNSVLIQLSFPLALFKKLLDR